MHHALQRDSTLSTTTACADRLPQISYNFAGGGIAYILGAEVPTAALREKTIGLGAAVNVLFAILIKRGLHYFTHAIQRLTALG